MSKAVATPIRDNNKRRRELYVYPSSSTRGAYQALIVLVTVALYYQLYVGGAVVPLVMAQYNMPFSELGVILAGGNLAGACASLYAGATDRFGRANLIVYGLLIVALMTGFAIPHAPGAIAYGIEYGFVAVVEGIILVATPALMRDFSPQVGRATAMGIWSIGSVVGSLLVSFMASMTLGQMHTWQSQYVIAGSIGLVVFAVAFMFLRELAPGLRDQVIVSLKDIALAEKRAHSASETADLSAPFRQLFHIDVVGSAVGLSLLLLPYYTTISFGTIFFVTIFHYSLAQSNALFNWSWAADAVALVITGVVSDRLLIRKPFMLFGSLGEAIVLGILIFQILHQPSWPVMVFLLCLQAGFGGVAYTAWMASYTETVEARNPALVATGLGISGGINRVVVTASFLVIPLVVTTVTPLLESSSLLAAYVHAQAAHIRPSQRILDGMAAFHRASEISPRQWQLWWSVCVAGMLIFAGTIFLMRGRWTPAAARADLEVHDRATLSDLAVLESSLTAL